MGSNDVMFIPRRMHRNQAFRKLNSSSIFVLFEFLSRRQLKQVPTRAGRKKDWIISNNGEIFFTYDEAKIKFGISRSTFRRAIDQLVDLGFIDIAHHGGGMMKDASKYAISERWKEYGKKEFLKKSRPKDKRGLGFTKENWKKTAGKHRPIQKVSTTRDTTSSTAHDTVSHKYLVTPSISNGTHQIDINNYIFKGLEVLDALQPTQYH
jgi:hypothetical protein